MDEKTRHYLAAGIAVALYALWLITDYWLLLAWMLGLFTLWRARSHIIAGRRKADDDTDDERPHRPPPLHDVE